MKKALLMLLGVFLFVTATLAQEKTVTGKVTDEDGLTLPGVSVKVKGTGTGVSTRADGNYSIRVSLGAVLQFSFIGTVTEERTVGEGNLINVTLSTSTNSLNEVVVTAFGITREKKAVGYATQTIQGGDIAKTQRENFLNALQGRVAGATITPSSGLPGSSSQMIIRGAVSFDGDNQPLFVVDGLPISNRTFSDYDAVGQGSFNRTNDYSNKAMDINPEDIQSISILKGPEASALYGTDGASGAVIITTKRAKVGSVALNYNNSFRLENVNKFPEVQTEYGPGSGGFFDDDVRTYFGSKYPANSTFYNNLSNFYKTGFTQKHSLSVEGGTEALSIRFSSSYDDQDGVMPGTGFNRLNSKLTGTAKLSPKISMNTSLSFISSSTQKTYKGANSPMISVLSWPIIDDMRVYLTPEGNRRVIDPAGSLTVELDNPYWGVEKNPNTEKSNRLLGNFGFDYKPSNWLSIAARAGADTYSEQILSAYHPQSFSGAGPRGSLNTSGGNSRLFNGSLVASVKKNFGKFSPVLRIGSNMDYSKYEVTSTRGEKFFKQDFYSMNNTDPTSQRVYTSEANRRKVGVFGNFELGYNDLLYLTLTGRYDKSSTLPRGNQGFFYPATSLSFVFSELKPFQNLSVLSFGKLRASYGESGKDARTPYVTATRLVPQSTTGGGFSTDVTAGNPNLEAEFTKAAEAGIELGFFKDRLSFDFSYYRTLSDKQITAPRLSYATGAILQYVNGGKIRYRGFELMAKGTPIKTRDFAWDMTANFSRSRGNILALPGGQETFYLSDTWLFANVRAQYAVGSSVSSFGANAFARNKDGNLLINPSNGMPIRTTIFEQLGDRAPDLSVGFTNSFTYKNLNLSFLLDIRKGGDIYNATELYLYARGLSRLSLDRELPRVITGVLRDGLENSASPTQNNIAIIPYVTQTYYSSFYSEQDFIQKDVNWIRLKDITLSYNLPKSLIERTKVAKSASVFVTGTDLFMFTNYKGIDPAVNGLNASSGGLGGSGIDYGNLGLPRGVNFGVRLGF
jgi:TonB-linked SusC/RagA family outer membrane protein